MHCSADFRMMNEFHPFKIHSYKVDLNLSKIFQYYLDALDLDDAFKVGKKIAVDRSVRPKKVTVTIGKTDQATGQIDETYLLEHTGYVDFPDENNKRYPFWYYPAEGILKWSSKKGTGWAGDIWTAERDPSSELIILISID